MITSFNNYPPSFYDHVDPPSLEGHIPLNSGSPKKKKHLMKTAQSTHKKKKSGCTCKKTFCLKMYCECFASNRICGEECGCLSCKNSLAHLETLGLDRNFSNDSYRREVHSQEKHCNCKKSHCLKRYCECYSLGVGCSPSCKCEEC
jgi:hypothetical protein